MEKILIIEDDEMIAELERDYLEANGYGTKLAFDGIIGEKLARSGDFDAILLDVMLPGKTGFDICRDLRRDMKIPIIMVTAKKEDIDKIRGLGLGADDYLVKPFSPAELVARVKSHINIHRLLLEDSGTGIQEMEQEISYGSLRILPKSRRVYLNQKEVILVNKEFELLLFLAENPNLVFSKDTLFDRVWGLDSLGDAATVTVHINRLRDKLGKDNDKNQFIETVWGAGYRFRID
jgi:DNA-binding response OmpR family regulator